MMIRLLVLSGALLVSLFCPLETANAQAAKSKTAEKQEDGGMPNALQGFSRNKNEPVKIESNKLEVRDKEKLAIFTGNVFVQQGDTTMRCPELRVFYEGDAKTPGAGSSKTGAAKSGTGAEQPEGNPAPVPVAEKIPVPAKSAKASTTETNVQQKIKKLEALGGVIVTSKDQKATGDRADFEMKANTVVMTGNVVVTQGQNVMRGDRLIVDLNSSRAHMEAGTKGNPGRVQGLFLPSDKDKEGVKEGAKKDKPKKGQPH
jgi:lipopolysaccharide export system protein LptA